MRRDPITFAASEVPKTVNVQFLTAQEVPLRQKHCLLLFTWSINTHEIDRITPSPEPQKRKCATLVKCLALSLDKTTASRFFVHVSILS
ncbi:hypothetical protein TGRH88_027050 [Toxoplasma gondii]|uniref:Uncharacterized protein n=1 Tax=Toxoplasma gondii TaxID=5811 RepID=A0A7J6KBF1_TOXGO|nr:hypothetical protein TGRH88_027050 [Toxoplasma gondii]